MDLHGLARRRGQAHGQDPPPSVFSEARGEPEMRRESAFEEARGMIGPAAWSQDGKVRELYCVLGGL